MSVFLSEEDKDILAWAKKKKKAEEEKNPQDGIPTVAASPVDDAVLKDHGLRITQLEAKSKDNKSKFDKSIAGMAKASMGLTQQVAIVMSDVNKLRKESEEQNTFRRNEIKGLRTTIETLEEKVETHDRSIKTHRQELNTLNLKL